MWICLKILFIQWNCLISHKIKSIVQQKIKVNKVFFIENSLYFGRFESFLNKIHESTRILYKFFVHFNKMSVDFSICLAENVSQFYTIFLFFDIYFHNLKIRLNFIKQFLFNPRNQKLRKLRKFSIVCINYLRISLIYSLNKQV